MCFSAEADLLGGLVVGALGIDVARHVGGRRQFLALAALPVLLAAHQIDEAFVWWGLQGHVSETAGRVATWAYLLLRAGGLIVAAYVAATCGALIFSSARDVAIFGIVNLVAVAVLARLAIDGFASLWRAWAAISSGALAAHIRFGRSSRTLRIVRPAA